jgi:hypothetical protein
MFPVRYELNSYILFRRNSVFKGLISTSSPLCLDDEMVIYRENFILHTSQTADSTAGFRFPVEVSFTITKGINITFRESNIDRSEGRAVAQAVSRWLPNAAVRGSKPDVVMSDLWWDKVALGQVFSEFFGFPCNRRSLHQLLHNHPHVSSGENVQ